MPSEWYYISIVRKKNEEKRDVRRDLVRDDDDGFTIHDDVPIVKVNEEQDDEDESQTQNEKPAR